MMKRIGYSVVIIFLLFPLFLHTSTLSHLPLPSLTILALRVYVNKLVSTWDEESELAQHFFYKNSPCQAECPLQCCYEGISTLIERPLLFLLAHPPHKSTHYYYQRACLQSDPLLQSFFSPWRVKRKVFFPRNLTLGVECQKEIKKKYALGELSNKNSISLQQYLKHEAQKLIDSPTKEEDLKKVSQVWDCRDERCNKCLFSKPVAQALTEMSLLYAAVNNNDALAFLSSHCGVQLPTSRLLREVSLPANPVEYKIMSTIITYIKKQGKYDDLHFFAFKEIFQSPLFSYPAKQWLFSTALQSAWLTDDELKKLDQVWYSSLPKTLLNYDAHTAERAKNKEAIGTRSLPYGPEQECFTALKNTSNLLLMRTRACLALLGYGMPTPRSLEHVSFVQPPLNRVCIKGLIDFLNFKQLYLLAHSSLGLSLARNSLRHTAPLKLLYVAQEMHRRVCSPLSHPLLANLIPPLNHALYSFYSTRHTSPTPSHCVLMLHPAAISTDYTSKLDLLKQCPPAVVDLCLNTYFKFHTNCLGNSAISYHPAPAAMHLKMLLCRLQEGTSTPEAQNLLINHTRRYEKVWPIVIPFFKRLMDNRRHYTHLLVLYLSHTHRWSTLLHLHKYKTTILDKIRREELQEMHERQKYYISQKAILNLDKEGMKNCRTIKKITKKVLKGHTLVNKPPTPRCFSLK